MYIYDDTVDVLCMSVEIMMTFLTNSRITSERTELMFKNYALQIVML